MTPDYMYEEMTWAEIGDAIEYVHQYEIKDSHMASGIWKKNKRLDLWWKRETGRPDREIQRLLRDVKKGK